MRGDLEFTSWCVCTRQCGGSKCVGKGSLMDSTFHICSILKNLSLREQWRCHHCGEKNWGGRWRGAPFGSNRWFCNVSGLRSPQRRAIVTGCTMHPQPPSPLGFAVLAHSRLDGTRGAGGSVAEDWEQRAALPRTRSQAWRGGETGPRRSGSAGSKRARAALLGRLADTCLASNSGVATQGREQRRSGYGRAARLQEGRRSCLGEARGPTYWQPDGPGLAAAGRGGGVRGLSVIIMHSARSSRLQLFSLANP